VRRVIIEENNGIQTARGVELVSGSMILAKHEVIISTGSYRTPGVLMHSGIGPAPTLDKFHIPVIVDNPAVGSNYFDHFSIPLYWKVKSQKRVLLQDQRCGLFRVLPKANHMTSWNGSQFLMLFSNREYRLITGRTISMHTQTLTTFSCETGYIQRQLYFTLQLLRWESFHMMVL
jgi:choline dehydrogenase-like flavoprotein